MISRLWGTGVSIMLARMYQFNTIYNSTGATWLPPEVFMKEEWRLETSVSAYGELGAADPPVRSGEL